MTGTPPVRPTRDDDVLAGLSELVGGPAGEHDRGHPWWTPIRVLLAVTAICFGLGMVQKAPCASVTWQNGEDRYSQMCYSDLPYLYTGRGFAELKWPYDPDADARARYEMMEYPVGISYFAWADAWADALALGLARHRAAARQRPSSDVWGQPGVVDEVLLYVVTTALGDGAVRPAGHRFLSGVHRRRPWDAAALRGVAPALILTGLVNWDLLAVVLRGRGALGLVARPAGAGPACWSGLGTATKLYPLFLLGGAAGRSACAAPALAPSLVARRSGPPSLACVVNLPGVPHRPRRSGRSSGRSTPTAAPTSARSGWSSQQAADARFAAAHRSTTGPWVFFGRLVPGGAGARAAARPTTPRLAQLGFLVVAGFLLVNKVYSPQYVLWLLPLAVAGPAALARPAVWQAGEVLYFARVWWYLGGYLERARRRRRRRYWIAIVPAHGGRALPGRRSWCATSGDPWQRPGRPLRRSDSDTRSRSRRGRTSSRCSAPARSISSPTLGHRGAVRQEQHRGLHVRRLGEEPLLAVDRSTASARTRPRPGRRGRGWRPGP